MSWVIVDRTTLEGVHELFNEMNTKLINNDKYKAVPIRLYLESLNLKTQEEKREHMGVEYAQRED